MNFVGKRHSLKAIIFLVLWISGCSDVRLSVPKSPAVNAKSEGGFCLSDPVKMNSFTKYLFVVDKSGSNRDTDNGGVKRATNIQKFINEKKDISGVMWGLLGFGPYDEVYPYIAKGNQPKFTSDHNEALAGVNKMKSNMDNGNTPYRSALTSARDMIAQDRKEFPDQKSLYMVFFISDGVPTDISSQSQLDGLVKDIIDAAPNVILSTAFYGDSGGDAIGRLEMMAKTGKGTFINFEDNDEWDFNDLIPEPTVQPWLLKKFLVYNVNAGYCIDGSVDTDSDGDGMCDKDEANYEGFDPANRFSFNDGYGDYFHWRRVVYGETLPKCMDRSDEDHDLLTFCEEMYIENLTPPDGIPKHGDPKNPDTDRDGILDGIETFVYFTSTMAFAMDNKNLARAPFDGEEDAETQIDQHRSPLVRDIDQLAYDTHISRDDFSGAKDCYAYSQQVLPLFKTKKVDKKNTLEWLEHNSNENVVLAYYIQTPKSDPSSNGIYKYSYQNLKRDPVNSESLGVNAGLKIRDFVFTSYETPER